MFFKGCCCSCRYSCCTNEECDGEEYHFGRVYHFGRETKVVYFSMLIGFHFFEDLDRFKRVQIIRYYNSQVFCHPVSTLHSMPTSGIIAK